ncbi:hypothetical protein MASR2M79_08360 [Aminivibrio sp.]
MCTLFSNEEPTTFFVVDSGFGDVLRLDSSSIKIDNQLKSLLPNQQFEKVIHRKDMFFQTDT